MLDFVPQPHGRLSLRWSSPMALMLCAEVCLIGTSHFVAMGVMSADAPLQDSQSNDTDGEEVIWASGQRSHSLQIPGSFER